MLTNFQYYYKTSVPPIRIRRKGGTSLKHTDIMSRLARIIPELGAEHKKNFWNKVNKNGPLPDQSIVHYNGLNNCWTWEGHSCDRGYGKFSICNIYYKAHRISYSLNIGHVSQDIFVCHKCDNPSCVNPDHLFLGDYQANATDKENKNRGNQPKGDACGVRLHPESRPRGDQHHLRRCPELRPKGERNGNSKLTEEKVREIRALYSNGGLTQRQIGDMYGINNGMVSSIVRGISWSHI